MASTFTSTAAAATAPVYQPMGDGVACAKATYELTAALVVDDIIQMVRLPKNAVVLDVVLVTDDLDSNGTPTLTLDVGYGGDDDYFIAASTVAQAGGVARSAASTAHPLTLSAEDTIDIHVDTAPATGTTGTVSLCVYYVAY